MAVQRRIWEIIAGGSVLLGIFGVGYSVGSGSAGEQIAALEDLNGTLIEVLQEPRVQSVLPPDFQVAVDSADDLRRGGEAGKASDLIKENVKLVGNSDCLPSGQSAELLKGAAVVNCETGMRAVLTNIDGVKNGYFTTGSTSKYGTPGTVFTAADGRYPKCFLLYEANLSEGDKAAAKVSFDCQKPEE